MKSLREADFPVPMAVINLSQPPDSRALKYRAMWAYGAHFRSNIPDGIGHVTFDSGIAHITDEGLEDVIDVGILKSILLVTFGSMNVVLMEGRWFKKIDQGRASTKRDRYGFWTVKPDSFEDSATYNPYALPEKISQVFFMADTRDPNTRVVLRNDIRSIQTIGNRELPYFGASGSEDDLLSIPTLYVPTGHTQTQEAPLPGVVVHEEDVQVVDIKM